MNDDRLLALCELAQAGLVSTSLLHEIRQPVFALQALVQQTDSIRWTDEHASDLRTLVSHLEEILHTWSPVGRPEAPRLHDVRESVDQVLRMSAARVAAAQVELLFERPEEPVWCERRPSLARQILLNLVRNAVDAVAGHDERRVEIRITGGDQVLLEVRDTGSGVPDHVRKQLFEPFVTGKRDGTGLGLYISRRLCRDAGGDLTLDSDPTVARATFDAGHSTAGPS